MTVASAKKRPPAAGRKRRSDHPVTGYARDVVAGRAVTGQLVRQACERHLRDLRAGAKRGLRFDPDDATDAIEFFGHLPQHKGRWAGEPLTLLPWEAFCIGSVFGWKRWSKEARRWVRRFRTAYISVARKNGKTSIAAGVGVYLLDFDDEAGAEVYAAATKRDQARICWDEAGWMVRNTPALAARIRVVESRANMHVPETASKFEALGADYNSLDGLNTHGCVVDELHAHKTRHLVDVLEESSAARDQPLFFYITTAGLERESIYSEIDDYARRVVGGQVQDDGWFCYVATIDPDDDWRDERVYVKANPSLGATVRLEDMRPLRDRALQMPGRVNSFKRQRLNVRTGQFEAWFAPEQWDACYAPPDLDELRGRRCFGGLDLASTTDIAAFELWFPNDEGPGGDLLSFFWVPEESSARRWEQEQVPYPEWIAAGLLRVTDGNLIDYDVIREDIVELAGLYEIVEIGYDPWNATQLATQLQDEGAAMVRIPQTYGGLSAAAKTAEGLIASKNVRHDGNRVMRWMVLNVEKQEDGNGNMKPNRKRSADKIDGVTAWLMALNRAIAHGGGEDGRSVYEDEGLTVL